MMEIMTNRNTRENVICHPSGDESVFPSYELRPRSWKKSPGWSWPWAKPRFDYNVPLPRPVQSSSYFRAGR